MTTCDWAPFVKAAVERNPVSVEMTRDMSIDQVYRWLEKMDNFSIYDGARLAQLEQREARTGQQVRTIGQVINALNRARRSSSLYIKLIGSRTGAVVNGEVGSCW